MKFLLDVCVSSRSLTAFLVALGHDVVSALAIDPSASDEHLLALALQDDRVLLTEDKDFGDAAKDMLAHDTGVLSATTAFGKTVIAAWLIAKRGVNTLVLVHRRQLLEQWVERLSSFLDLPPKAVGFFAAARQRA